MNKSLSHRYISKRILSVLIPCILFTGCIKIQDYEEIISLFDDSIVAASNYGSGNGTQGSPYLIQDASQLKKLVEDVYNGNKHSNIYIKLMIDIYITADDWIPIGNDEKFAFNGNFDGNGHTVSGTLKSENQMFFGLFGYLGENARISNLIIAASVIHLEIFSGCIAGLNSGEITNCTVLASASISGGIYNFGGGIVGMNLHSGFIQNCTNNASLSGEYSGFGGLAAVNDGIINNCTNNGIISLLVGDYQDVGGIVGSNRGIITNCTNNAAVVSVGYSVGGIAGANEGNGIIHTCLNTGNISGSARYIGGLAGLNGSYYSNSAHVYSCCTNHGTVEVLVAGIDNQIGGGSDVEACPNGHTKRD